MCGGKKIIFFLMESGLPRELCIGDPTPTLGKAERAGLVRLGKEKLWGELIVAFQTMKEPARKMEIIFKGVEC